MKYEIVKIGLDTYSLNYKDQKKEFKTTVGLASQIQKYKEEAGKNIYFDLAKKGMSVEDLKIKKIINGKEYVDESNLVALRQKYEDEALLNALDNVCEKAFGLKLADLAYEVGATTEEESAQFGMELMSKMMGADDEKTPSKEKEEIVSN